MPRVCLHLAYRWLNIDTYWELTAVADPDALRAEAEIPRKADLGRPIKNYPPELLENYPLKDRQQSGARRSSLHDILEPDLAVLTLVEQLVNQLQGELNRRNLSEARAKVYQIETVCAGLPVNSANTLFQAEALLACGLAYRKIGENSRALDYFEKSLKGFGGQDNHAEAVVRWMIGVIQLETPKTLLNDGLLNWQAAWKIFATAAGENRRSQVESQWYRDRANRMFADLQQATAEGRLPPPPDTVPVTPASSTAGAVPAPSATAAGGPTPTGSGPARPASAAPVSGPMGAGSSAPAWGSVGPTPPPPAPGDSEVKPPPKPAPDSAEAAAGRPASSPEPTTAEPASISTRIFVNVPSLGPIIIGGSDTPKGEGELFWSHDLQTTLRLVNIVGGKKTELVMERVDGLDFPAELGASAQKQRLFSEELFNRQLERQKWIWLPLPRPVGAALRFAEVISPPSPVAAWLQLANVPVCESVAADPWGTPEARAREDQQGTLTFPWVYFDLDAGKGKQKRYCLRGFKNEGIIRLNNRSRSDEYAFMRVTGDSMNAAAPYPICPGDWVLVRRTDKPADFKIVVANVSDANTGDYQATLKRKRPDGLYSESTADYQVVPVVRVAGYVGEVVAIAKPDSPVPNF
jgi:hypothetical protein